MVLVVSNVIDVIVGFQFRLRSNSETRRDSQIELCNVAISDLYAAWLSVRPEAMSSPSPPAVEITKIPDVGEPGRDELKQQCFDVRTAVFTHEQGFPWEIEIDE